MYSTYGAECAVVNEGRGHSSKSAASEGWIWDSRWNALRDYVRGTFSFTEKTMQRVAELLSPNVVKMFSNELRMQPAGAFPDLDVPMIKREIELAPGVGFEPTCPRGAPRFLYSPVSLPLQLRLKRRRSRARWATRLLNPGLIPDFVQLWIKRYIE